MEIRDRILRRNFLNFHETTEHLLKLKEISYRVKICAPGRRKFNPSVIFVPFRSRVDMLEDEPVGFPVLHVIANDDDSHLNGQVYYAISGGNVGRHFAIDSDSGLITLSKVRQFSFSGFDLSFLMKV